MRYRLNGLDDAWIYEGANEEECTKELIHAICYAKTIKQYERYCKDVGVDPTIEWTEVKDEEEDGDFEDIISDWQIDYKEEE